MSEATDTTIQLESSYCESSGNTGSLDLVITESEFDKDVIKNLLAGVWVSYFCSIILELLDFRIMKKWCFLIFIFVV